MVVHENIARCYAKYYAYKPQRDYRAEGRHAGPCYSSKAKKGLSGENGAEYQPNQILAVILLGISEGKPVGSGAIVK